MKLFIDSGNIKDIEAAAALGIIDGVTTNPSLLAKEPGDYRQNLKRICQIVKGPVSGEVTATDTSGMLQQGHDIASIDEHMVVKVPLTRDGIKACKALSGRDPDWSTPFVTMGAEPKSGGVNSSPELGYDGPP